MDARACTAVSPDNIGLLKVSLLYLVVNNGSTAARAIRNHERGDEGTPPACGRHCPHDRAVRPGAARHLPRYGRKQQTTSWVGPPAHCLAKMNEAGNTARRHREQRPQAEPAQVRPPVALIELCSPVALANHKHIALAVLSVIACSRRSTEGCFWSGPFAVKN